MKKLMILVVLVTVASLSACSHSTMKVRPDTLEADYDGDLGESAEDTMAALERAAKAKKLLAQAKLIEAMAGQATKSTTFLKDLQGFALPGSENESRKITRHESNHKYSSKHKYENKTSGSIPIVFEGNKEDVDEARAERADDQAGEETSEDRAWEGSCQRYPNAPGCN